MTNGFGSPNSLATDFAYMEQARGAKQARAAIRNFPINVSFEGVYNVYLQRYEYSERHEEVEAWVLRETQKQCLKLYPDGQHPFMKLEKLPDDYLSDSRKPPSGRTLREIARVRHIVRAVARQAQRRNLAVARPARKYA